MSDKIVFDPKCCPPDVDCDECPVADECADHIDELFAKHEESGEV